MHPGRVLTSAQMLTNWGEASQAVSEKIDIKMVLRCPTRWSRFGGNREPAGDFRLTLTAIADDDIGEKVGLPRLSAQQNSSHEPKRV